jgi:hypothetical protein
VQGLGIAVKVGIHAGEVKYNNRTASGVRPVLREEDTV